MRGFLLSYGLSDIATTQERRENTYLAVLSLYMKYMISHLALYLNFSVEKH